MATPNYGFEKRQKELAKKRKKEDKLKAKSDRKSGLFAEDGSEIEGEEGDAGDDMEDMGAPLRPKRGRKEVEVEVERARPRARAAR